MSRPAENMFGMPEPSTSPRTSGSASSSRMASVSSMHVAVDSELTGLALSWICAMSSSGPSLWITTVLAFAEHHRTPLDHDAHAGRRSAARSIGQTRGTLFATWREQTRRS